MPASNVAAAVAFGLFCIGSGVTEVLRMNDPEEPLFPLHFPRWRHARRGVTWVAAAVAALLVAGVLRLMGR